MGEERRSQNREKCVRGETVCCVHLNTDRRSVVLRDYRHSRWTPGTIKYNVALGGKWRRHADQIHSSNIPIKQDTDIQFNKPTVKSTILPLD